MKNMLPGLVAGSLWLLVTAGNIYRLPPRYMPRVQTITVQREPFPLVVQAPGVLQPKRSLTLKAAFDGPIVAKYFREGQGVRAGTLLLEIGRDKIKSDYLAKEMSYKNAVEDLAKAQKELRIQKSLYQKQAVALSSVEDARRALTRAIQALEAAQTAFQFEKERWNQNKIVAPFAGTIIQDGVLEERTVTSGQVVLTLADISEYTVAADVDELEMGRLRPGQKAEIRLQAYENHPLSGRLIRLGTQAQGHALPQIPVFLSVEPAPGVSLMPGLTAEVRIFVGMVPEALAIPLTAIHNAEGAVNVWVVEGASRVHPRQVALGPSNPDRVQVLSGLAAGDRVVVSSGQPLRQGLKVIPLE